MSGKLGEIGVKKGQLLNEGSQLAYLVPPQTWGANLKETEMSRVRIGQSVTIKVPLPQWGKFAGQSGGNFACDWLRI